MFNLLPKHEMSAIKREYRFRLLVVALSLTLSIIAVSLVGLIPALFLSYEQEVSIGRENAASQSSPETPDSKTINQTVTRTKEELSSFLDTPANRPLYRISRVIFADRAQGLTIVGIDITAAGKQGYQVTVSGHASNREVLLGFEHALQKEPALSNINLPISDLAPSANIDFSITLTATPASS